MLFYLMLLAVFCCDLQIYFALEAFIWYIAGYQKADIIFFVFAQGGSQVNQSQKEQVVITVLGANKPGILAGITKAIAEANVNVEDVSQKIMQDLFALMMMTDFSMANCSFENFQTHMQEVADQLKVKIFIQHEDVFRFQHRL